MNTDTRKSPDEERLIEVARLLAEGWQRLRLRQIETKKNKAMSDVPLMDGNLADMVFTDPPYNVDYGNTAKDKIRAKGGKKAGRTIMNDNLGEGFEQFLYDACVNLLSVCKGAVYPYALGRRWGIKKILLHGG